MSYRLANAVGLVLREAQLAREGRLETKHAPFAEHMCRIPLEHINRWHKMNGVLLPPLRVLFPGWDSKNHDEAEAAMNAFHASEYADPYRVRSRQAQLGAIGGERVARVAR